jgi:hypothetical protein
MSERRCYHCLNCGYQFVIDVLTPGEKRKFQKRNLPFYRVACPKCHQTDVVKKI